MCVDRFTIMVVFIIMTHMTIRSHLGDMPIETQIPKGTQTFFLTAVIGVLLVLALVRLYNVVDLLT